MAGRNYFMTLYTFNCKASQTGPVGQALAEPLSSRHPKKKVKKQ